MSTDNSHVLTQTVHDLSSALWFGGAVMGVAGVNKSGHDLDSGIDKMRVSSSAWTRFAPLEWVAIAAVLLADARLARAGSGRRELRHRRRGTDRAKSAVALAGVAATAFATYGGQKIGRVSEQVVHEGRPFDVHDASLPNARTPAEIATWQQRHRLMQYAVPALAGANIVLNACVRRPGCPRRQARDEVSVARVPNPA